MAAYISLAGVSGGGGADLLPDDQRHHARKGNEAASGEVQVGQEEEVLP